MPNKNAIYTANQLQIYQSMPLEAKINLTYQRIKQFYDKFHGSVYVAFSGGKDSTVMLDLVRRFYPNVPGVFVNTGLEFPEIIDFVKTIDNITWLKPSMTFKAILEKYGYPVVSKQQAQYIREYRETKSEKIKHDRWHGKYGRKMFKIAEKWKYLLNAPFLISEKCCKYMKKIPSNDYAKETGRYGYVGMMADDSRGRWIDYMKYGCNAFDKATPQGRPLMFWKNSDIWDYIKMKNLPYSKIYDMGYKNTGCIFCAFGAHLNYPNRFQIMKKTHPKLWKYCIEKLNMGEVLDYCKIPYQDYYIQNELQ